MSEKKVYAQLEELPAAAELLKGGYDALKGHIIGPATKQISPDASGELGVSQKTNLLQDLAQQENQAVAALGLYGWTKDDVVGFAKDIEQNGLGEPMTIYGYLSKVGSMGLTSYSDPQSVLTLAKYLLAKRFGDTQKALSDFNMIAGFASRIPELNLMQMAADSFPPKSINPMPSLYAVQLDPKNKGLNLFELMTFFNYIDNPNSPEAVDALKHATIRHDRRVQQQLYEMKIDEVLRDALNTADKKATATFENWIRGLQPGGMMRWTLEQVKWVYFFALSYHTFMGATGIRGTGFAPSNSQTASSSADRVVVAAGPPVNPPGAPTAPFGNLTPSGSQPATPPATGATGTGNLADANTGQDLMSLLMGTVKSDPAWQADAAALNKSVGDYTKSNIVLNAQMANIKEESSNIANYLKTNSAIGGGAGGNEGGPGEVLDQALAGSAGLGTPELILQAGQTLKSLVIQTRAGVFNEVKVSLNNLSTLISKHPSVSGGNHAENTQSMNVVFQFLNAAQIGLQTKGQVLLGAELSAAAAISYGPIKREVDLLKIKLQKNKGIIAKWQNAGGIAAIMKLSIPQIYQEVLSIYKAIIGLDMTAIRNVDGAMKEEKSGNKPLLQNLYQLKSALYAEIQGYQNDSQAMEMELVSTMLPGGANMNVASPFATASVSLDKENSLIRLSEEQFKEKDEEDKDKEIGPMEKDADAEMQDYWNNLLPGYGSALEHPQKNRNKFIRYVPRKKIRYSPRQLYK